MNRIVQIQLDNGPTVECFGPADVAIHAGDQCIIDMEGVLEYGSVVQIEDATGDVEHECRLPRVLRQATLQDRAKANDNAVRGRIAMETCVQKAATFKLDIRLVRVHYSFDRTRLTVLFACEDRVDFREMIKELSQELNTRVDMHQIGVRDEAGIIGGLGICGRVLCCRLWLRQFESVNVKMAKIQRLSLNPGAISGMCGRLKCCLRYECDQYLDLARTLPRHGSRVECSQGEGTVIDSDVLRQRVRVRLDDTQRNVDCALDDIRPAYGRRQGGSL
jgi:cell fate regulator YaaT (PSP1 superfamily)